MCQSDPCIEKLSRGGDNIITIFSDNVLSLLIVMMMIMPSLNAEGNTAVPAVILIVITFYDDIVHYN